MEIALAVITGGSNLIMCSIIYQMYREYLKHDAIMALRENPNRDSDIISSVNDVDSDPDFEYLDRNSELINLL